MFIFSFVEALTLKDSEIKDKYSKTFLRINFFFLILFLHYLKIVVNGAKKYTWENFQNDLSTSTQELPLKKLFLSKKHFLLFVDF